MTASDVRVDRRGSSPKIGLPVPSTTTVRRSKHIEAMQAQRHLIIVRAPAGCGKTTLVGQWAASRRAAGDLIAWVTVDRFDNDPFAFWSLVVAAVDDAAAAGTTPLSSLISPRDATEPGFLDSFCEAVAALGRPVSLVIDDFHEIHDPDTLQSLELLARNVRMPFRLVLVSRTRPAIAIERLGLVDGYELLDPESLRFGRTEAAELLRLHSIDLDAEQLDEILEQTEGWAAGLRFVASTISSRRDPRHPAVPASMPIDAYLAEEIFERHGPDIRSFLLATAVCDHVNVDLATSLSGHDDAGAVLERLIYDNTLIVRLDSAVPTYRFHSLLRDYLRTRLRTTDPDRWRWLHGLASQWYEENGDPLQALAHAVSSDDDARIEHLMAIHSFEFIAHGEGPKLRSLIAAMTGRTLRRPFSALTAASAFLDIGDTTTADGLLAGLDRPDRPSEAFLTLESTVGLHRARISGDLAAALKRSLSTMTGRASGPYLELQTLFHQGVAMMYLGEVDRAAGPLRGALAIAVAHDEPYVTMQCLTYLSVLAGVRGDLNTLIEHGEHALEIGDRHGWSRTSVCAFAHVCLGGAMFYRVEGERAEAHLRTAIESLSQRSDPTLMASAESVLALVTFDSSNDQLATLLRLRSVWERFDDEVVTPGLLAYIAPYEVRMCLTLGLVSWIDDVIDRVERRLGECGELWLLQSVRALRRGQPAEANDHIDRLLIAPQSCVEQATIIEGWLVEAELAELAGEWTRCQTAIRHALTAAQVQRIYRPFLQVPASLRKSILQFCGREDAPPGAQQLVGLLADDASAAKAITDREIEVLRELHVSREIVVERTIEEAAAVLFISPNTAKSHLRSIYRKLGVNNREDAIGEARRRGLM
jgi:LuxR family transcriptional regulator, maltose regulon positive regulatory protein